MFSHPLRNLIISLNVLAMRTKSSSELMRHLVRQDLTMASPARENVRWTKRIACLVPVVHEIPCLDVIPRIELVEQSEISLTSFSPAGLHCSRLRPWDIQR